jgi:hypothetical protein
MCPGSPGSSRSSRPVPSYVERPASTSECIRRAEGEHCSCSREASNASGDCLLDSRSKSSGDYWISHWAGLPVLRPGSLDVNQPLKSHHLRVGPAPVPHMVQGLFNWLHAAAQATVDDVLKTPRSGGFVARPRRPRADYRFPLASPRVMVVDPAGEGGPTPVRLVPGDDGDAEGLVLDGRAPDGSCCLSTWMTTMNRDSGKRSVSDSFPLRKHSWRLSPFSLVRSPGNEPHSHI